MRRYLYSKAMHRLFPMTAQIHNHYTPMQTAKYKTRRQAELGKVKRLVDLVITGKDGATDMDADTHQTSPTRGGKKRNHGKRAKKG